MYRRSRFDYAGGSVFECTLSTMPWVPADRTVGGMLYSAARVPASYVVRRDALLNLTLRVEEPDWTAMLNLIAWGQSAQAFTWYPDADDLSVSFAVYLDAPAPGNSTVFTPTREAAYPRVFDVPITLVGAGLTIPWTAYFTDTI